MILIVGASKGIGQYLYNQYRSEGTEWVFGTYCHTATPSLRYMDVNDYNSITELIESIRPKEGCRLSVAITAGVYDKEVLHHSTPEQWAEIIHTNIVGTYNVIRNVLPIMREEGFGRIILFSSVVGQIGAFGASAYTTSKAALVGLAKAISIENASKGITCNCINLGYSTIGMGKYALSEEQRTEVLTKIPMKRFCEAREIKQTVDYLLNTPYITGSSIDISGGMV